MPLPKLGQPLPKPPTFFHCDNCEELLPYDQCRQPPLVLPHDSYERSWMLCLKCAKQAEEEAGYHRSRTTFICECCQKEADLKSVVVLCEPYTYEQHLKGKMLKKKALCQSCGDNGGKEVKEEIKIQEETPSVSSI